MTNAPEAEAKESRLAAAHAAVAAALGTALKLVEGEGEPDKNLKAVLLHAVNQLDMASALLDLLKEEERTRETASGVDEEAESEDFALALTPDDLEGLPPELLSELNISETDKFEGFVIKAIRGAGGLMTIDQLLIAWWRNSNEVLKRQVMNNRLYRMTRKKLLWSVPNKKGVYTTDRAIGEKGLA